MFKADDFVLTTYCFCKKDTYHIAKLVSYKEGKDSIFQLIQISFLGALPVRYKEYDCIDIRWYVDNSQISEIQLDDTLYKIMATHTILSPIQEEFKEFLRAKFYKQFGRATDALTEACSEDIAKINTGNITDDPSTVWKPRVTYSSFLSFANYSSAGMRLR